MSLTHQDLSNDTTFSQIKSRVPVPLNPSKIFEGRRFLIHIAMFLCGFSDTYKQNISMMGLQGLERGAADNPRVAAQESA